MQKIRFKVMPVTTGRTSFVNIQSDPTYFRFLYITRLKDFFRVGRIAPVDAAGADAATGSLYIKQTNHALEEKNTCKQQNRIDNVVSLECLFRKLKSYYNRTIRCVICIKMQSSERRRCKG